MCEAIGTRPAVDLLWYHKGLADSKYVQIKDGIIQLQKQNAKNVDLYDTTSTLSNYVMSRDYHQGEIMCQVVGQQAIPSSKDIINIEVLCKYGWIIFYLGLFIIQVINQKIGRRPETTG